MICAFLCIGRIAASQSITILPITPAAYCKGASITVGYNTSGSFNSDNRFVLQMSDTSGSFGAFSNVATDLIHRGTFTFHDTMIGDHFRFRVIATSP